MDSIQTSAISKRRGPVFIMGRPRSGTTMLTAVLDAMPGIALHPEEQHFFMYWGHIYGARDLNDEAVFEEFMRDYVSHPKFKLRLITEAELRTRLLRRSPRRLADVLEAVCAHYADSTGKPRWGEKTPNHYRHLDTIRREFPDAQIILTMRDPRALLASLRKRDFGLRDPHDHALAWLEYARMLESLRGDPGVHIIEYEKFVSDANREVRRLCDFLGEPFSETLLGRKEVKRASGAANDPVRHYQRAVEPIDQASLEKWKSDLSPRHVRITEHLAGDAMRRWGYAPVSDGLTATDKIVMAVRYGMRPALDRLRGIKRKFTGSPTTVIPG